MAVFGDRVDQSGNHVTGDMAARDIIKHETVNTYNVTSRAESIFSQLMHKIPNIKQELESAQEVAKRIGDFDYYYSVVPSGELQSLEEKLRAASRDCFFEEGIEKKELFAKAISEHIFSETAQRVYVILLEQVEFRFKGFVLPALREGRPDCQISELILNSIINPLLAELPEMDIFISGKSIAGMIYFLTGKCILRWV